MDNSFVNHIKLFYIVMKIGGDVFVDTLKILYNGEPAIEDHLVDYADVKSNLINNDERELLANIKNGERDVKHMDITLTYKLIQITCGLEPRQTSLNNNCVWSKRCPKEKQKNLEHLLLKYKTERNVLAHQFANLGIISDQEFLKRKNENVNLLTAIVEKVGEKAELSEVEVLKWRSKVETDAQKISKKMGSVDRFEGGGGLVSEEEEDDDDEEEHEEEGSRGVIDIEDMNSGEDIIIQPQFPRRNTSIPRLPANGFVEYDTPKKNIEFESEGLEFEAKKSSSFSLNFFRCCKCPQPQKTEPVADDVWFKQRVSSAEIDSSLKKVILEDYETDLREESSKPFEKSNRLYWIEKLLTSDVLRDKSGLTDFWKEYGKNVS